MWTKFFVLATIASLAIVAHGARQAAAYTGPPLHTVPIDAAATAVDHDNGIYVVGTEAGTLYVVDEAGNYTMTSLSTDRISDVRIENRFIAVATGGLWISGEVIELELQSLPNLSPTELWRTTPDGGWVPSVDLSSDGAYVAYVSGYGSVGVYDGSGTLVHKYPKTHCDMASWLDATADMEYIAITMEVGASDECGGVNTGAELYRFDGSTVQRVWGTILVWYYETTEVRVSENKDYVAAATSSGTVMNLMDLANGNVLGTYDAGAEQFAVDGDDDLKYVIGGTVTPTYRYLVFKNLESGANYLSLIDDGSMSGALDSSPQVDSNPDASCVAFGSDAGDFILRRRTGDILLTVLSGTVSGEIGAIEVGGQTLLVASGSPTAIIELYPGCVPGVGGIVDIPVEGSGSLVASAGEGSAGSSSLPYAAFAGVAAAASLALAAGTLYARRRWLR